jgi:hypothetical protein
MRRQKRACVSKEQRCQLTLQGARPPTGLPPDRGLEGEVEDPENAECQEVHECGRARCFSYARYHGHPGEVESEEGRQTEWNEEGEEAYCGQRPAEGEAHLYANATDRGRSRPPTRSRGRC